MKKPKYVMSPSELRTLKEDAQMNRHMLKQAESEGYGAGSRGSVMDKAAIEKQARNLEKIAESHAPGKVTGQDRDKLSKRAEELREKLKDGMCSKDEMRDMRNHPDAPIKHLEWERRNGKNTGEYKQIMRRLEPQDPGAASVERFRK